MTQHKMSYDEILFQNEQLQATILKLDKENQDFKLLIKRMGDSEKKVKDLSAQVEILERDKNLLIEEKNNIEKSKHDIIMRKDLDFSAEVSRLKHEIDVLQEKVKNHSNLDKVKSVFENDVTLLKKELVMIREIFNKQMEDKERTHDMEYDQLNNEMLARINNTKQNIKQINLEHLDVNTKLTLLQNHQLLIELEYQSQQIQDLIQKKEALERRIFELEKDLEIHKEVENILAVKNKKVSNTLKNVVSLVESKGNSKTELSKLNGIFDKLNENKTDKIDINTGFSSSSKQSGNNTNNLNLNRSAKNFEETSLVFKLEAKIKNLEKIIYKKRLDYDTLKQNFDNIMKDLMKYTVKSKDILKLFETELEAIVKSGEVNNTDEVYINVDDIKNLEYENLNHDQKYSLLVLLIRYLIDQFGIEEHLEKDCFLNNVKKKTFELKLYNANNNVLNQMQKNSSKSNNLKNSFKKVLSSNSTVVRRQMFIEILPQLGDNRFSLNKKFSVLKQ